MVEEHFIFPLGTVLFPGGLLPLKIFEQRYVEMLKVCIRDSRPFGVCLIREGSEVGAPALPETVGCLADIQEWDMPNLGLFQVVARGGDRFRLLEKRIAPSGLMSASIERLPSDSQSADIDKVCQQVLKLIIEKVGASHFPAPIAMDDASWIGYRLSETLPLDTRIKQELLELTDADERLRRLRTLLINEGLVVQDA